MASSLSESTRILEEAMPTIIFHGLAPGRDMDLAVEIERSITGETYRSAVTYLNAAVPCKSAPCIEIVARSPCSFVERLSERVAQTGLPVFRTETRDLR